MIRGSVIICCCLIFLSACTDDDTIPAPNTVNTYIFLGHAYEWHAPDHTNRVDSRLEKIDYTEFNGIWLGGDMCTETTKDESTINYLDALFDLESPKTHWTLGNHNTETAI